MEQHFKNLGEADFRQQRRNRHEAQLKGELLPDGGQNESKIKKKNFRSGSWQSRLHRSQGLQYLSGVWL
jgi:hypothetical protein